MALALTAILTTHALAAFDMMGRIRPLGRPKSLAVDSGRPAQAFTARECFRASKPIPSHGRLGPGL